MCHIYGLKYSKHDVNKNKMEIKTLRVLLCLNGHVGYNKVNPLGSCVLYVISALVHTFGRKL